MKILTLLAFFAIISCVFAGDPKTEKEIQAALNSWKQAMIRGDKAALDRLYAADLIYTHSSGRHENKAQAIDGATNGKNRFESIELTDMAIRSYGNTAVANCKVMLKKTTDGVPNTTHLDVLFVWVKSAERWQLVARQAVGLNR